MAGVPPRLTRKPIPKAWKPWDREVRGIKKFLANLAKLADDYGEGWVGKQRRYYENRLQDLNNERPVRQPRRTRSRSSSRTDKRKR